MSYMGSTNKLVSCIYGTYNIKEGEEVPMLFAVKFPQYVIKLEDPVPTTIKVEETKKERKIKEEINYEEV